MKHPTFFVKLLSLLLLIGLFCGYQQVALRRAAAVAEREQKIALAEAHNRAESMCFELEKLLKEHSEKLRQEDKDAINAGIAKTREACKTDDVDKIKSAFSELEQASHAMSKALYEQAQQAQATAQAASSASAGAENSGDDDAIDADFEVKN